MGPLIVFIFWLILLTILGLAGVLFSYPFLSEKKKNRKMLLIFFTPAISFGLTMIGIALSTLSINRFFNLDIRTEGNESLFCITAFISFCLSTIITSFFWKKILN